MSKIVQLNNLYSIYDRKAQYYLPLMQHRSDTDAIREFTGLVTNSETPLAMYPADFDLMKVGVMDLLTADISSGRPEPLINGLVALQNAQAERQRYQAILNPQPTPEMSDNDRLYMPAETSPDAA